MVAVLMAFSRAAESEPRAIAHALRRRDPDFIDQLVGQYHYRLLRYLVYLTSQREQAEDLVQETWMRVLERAGQYNGRSRFEPWLFSIARNLAIDHLRRRHNLAEDADAVLEIIAAPEVQSPFAAAARTEDATRISGALNGLEPIYREALLLRFQEDLSLEEIAQVTRAPVATISSRIQRGLSRMRAQFSQGERAHAD
jgi:RNA polymerase sigma-70 factor (ECF subfamily)